MEGEFLVCWWCPNILVIGLPKAWVAPKRQVTQDLKKSLDGPLSEEKKPTPAVLSGGPSSSRPLQPEAVFELQPECSPAETQRFGKEGFFKANTRCGPAVHHPDTGSGFWLRYGFSRGKWIAPNKKRLRKAWYYFRRSFCTENGRVSIKTMPHKEVVRFAISTPWLLAGTLPDVQIPSLAPRLPVGGGISSDVESQVGVTSPQLKALVFVDRKDDITSLQAWAASPLPAANADARHPCQSGWWPDVIQHF